MAALKCINHNFPYLFFYLHCNKTALVAIIVKSLNTKVLVYQTHRHSLFFLTERTFPLLLQLLVISLKAKHISCKELVCARSCCRRITILFCLIALGIPFKWSDVFLIIALFHSSLPKTTVGLYPPNCSISIFKCQCT